MRRAGLLALATALALTTTTASALLIDDFSTGSQSVLIAVGGANPFPVADGVAAAGAVGGSRAINLTRTAGGGIASLDVGLSESDVLSFGTGAGVVANALVIYDGDTNAVPDFGLGGVDASDGGASTLLRLLLRSDLAATLQVQFSTDVSNFSTANIGVPGTGTDGPFQVIDVPFASFVASGSGVDFTNVTGITVGISGPASLDLQIDQISTVPEPGTLVLLLTGTAGLLAFGRKRS